MMEVEFAHDRFAEGNSVELQHYRLARQFIPDIADSGKMLYQMLRYRLNTADHAHFVVRMFKGCFPRAENLFPFLRVHPCVNPAISNNLDVAVGKQQINQHAVVVFGIPHP